MVNLNRNLQVEAEFEAAMSRDDHGTESIQTAGVAPNLRNAVWEVYNHSRLMGLKIGSPKPAGLIGTMRSAVVNGLSVADVTGNAHTVERTPAMAQQLRSECVLFTFMLSGESFHFNGSSPVLVKSGEVAVYDSDTPFLLGMSEGTHAVVASVPRYHLVDVGLQDAFRSLKVMHHTGNGVQSRSTRHLLNVLLGAFNRPSTLDPHEFAESLLGDVLQAVGQVAGGPHGRGKDYFAEATAFIERHLGDPNLSVAEIAHATHVSQRHLSRIFSLSGTTVSRSIMHQRLMHAHELLLSAEAAHMTAAEVAARSGFASASHFSRVFRQFFGMSPTDIRRVTQVPHID